MNEKFKNRMRSKNPSRPANQYTDDGSTDDQSAAMAELTGSEGSPLGLGDEDITAIRKRANHSEELNVDDLEVGSDGSSGIDEEEVTKMVEEYESTIADLNSKVESMSNLKYTEEEHKALISKHNDEIKDLESNIKDLTDQLENSNSSEDFDKISSELKASKETIERARAKVNDLNVKIKNFEKMESDFNSKIETLSSEKESLSIKISKLESENSDLLKSNEDLESNNKELKESGNVSDSILKELEDLKSKLKASQGENQKLVDTNAKLTQDILDLNKEQKTMVENHKSEMDSMQETIESLKENQVEEENTDEEIIFEYDGTGYTESEIKEITKRRGPKSKEEHKLIEKYFEWQDGNGMTDAEAVPEKIFDYVSNKTIQSLIGKYKSDIYSPTYSDKLFTDYVNGDVDYSDTLFKTLIKEVFDKDTANEYLGSDLSKELYAYIGRLYK